ncbi:carboxypeptidase-like regulatory domain-containing protein [Candidatus Similichlamydia laticola]|uniref:Uncharacterized protein n=1 Tax=Candidatus Similichlamydia laticola TaxID=2170265 RepID=A0A369KCN3_9BACT|nr:carboxypeptidase-like regulatory domain-containing protein [Candidatus Similichlamydia laticola]RDB31668.1 hypothetical protein HAT2_00176 [Candidatus Similichlamydia laticola]
MRLWGLCLTLVLFSPGTACAQDRLTGRSLESVIATLPGKTLRVRLWLSCTSYDDRPYTCEVSCPERWKILQSPTEIAPGPFSGKVEVAFFYVPPDTVQGTYPLVFSVFSEGVRILDIPVVVEVLEQVSIATHLGFVPFYIDPDDGLHFTFSVHNTGNVYRTIIPHQQLTAIRQEACFSPSTFDLAPNEEKEICVHISFKERIVVARTFAFTVFLEDRVTGNTLATFLVTTNLIPGKGASPLPSDNVIPSILTLMSEVDRSRTVTKMELAGVGGVTPTMSLRYNLVGTSDLVGGVLKRSIEKYSLELFNEKIRFFTGDGDQLGLGMQLLPARGRGIHGDYCGLPHWRIRLGLWKELSSSSQQDTDPAHVWSGMRSAYEREKCTLTFSLLEKVYTQTDTNPEVRSFPVRSLMGIGFQARHQLGQIDGEWANSMQQEKRPRAFAYRLSGRFRTNWGLSGYGLVSLNGKDFPASYKEVAHSEGQFSWNDQTTTVSGRFVWDEQVEPGEGDFAGSDFHNTLYVTNLHWEHRTDRGRFDFGSTVIHEQRIMETFEGKDKSELVVFQPFIFKRIPIGTFDARCAAMIYNEEQRISLWEAPLADLVVNGYLEERNSDGRFLFGFKMGYDFTKQPPRKRFYGNVGYSNTVHQFPYGLAVGIGTSGAYRRRLINISCEWGSPDSWYPHMIKLNGSMSVTNLTSRWSVRFSWSRPIGVIFKWSQVAFLSGHIKEQYEETRVEKERFIVALGSYRTMTDEKGRYVFLGVPAGEYTLKLESTTPHWIDMPLPFEVLRLSPRENRLQDLYVSRPASIKGSLELFGRRESAVMSTVKGSPQEESFFSMGGAAGLTIMATPLDGGAPVFVKTRPNGAFEITPIHPGRWKIILLPSDLPRDTTSLATEGVILECQPGETQTISWQIYPKKKQVKMIN